MQRGIVFHYINGKFDYHQRVYKISDFADVNAKFVMFSMKRDFKSHALQNTSKATVDSIRLPTLTEFEFLLPSREEQQAIAGTLNDIESLLKQHSDKLGQLKQIKGAMLDKMFPKGAR